jgi:hypothetical protein
LWSLPERSDTEQETVPVREAEIVRADTAGEEGTRCPTQFLLEFLQLFLQLILPLLLLRLRPQEVQEGGQAQERRGT